MSDDIRDFIDLYSKVSNTYKKDGISIKKDFKFIFLVYSPFLVFCIWILLIWILNTYTPFLSEELFKKYVFSAFGIFIVYSFLIFVINVIGLILDIIKYIRSNRLSIFNFDRKKYGRLSCINIDFIDDDYKVNNVLEIITHKMNSIELKRGVLTYLIGIITIVGSLVPNVLNFDGYNYSNVFALVLMPMWLYYYLESFKLNDCKFVLNRRVIELSRSSPNSKKNLLKILRRFFK